MLVEIPPYTNFSTLQADDRSIDFGRLGLASFGQQATDPQGAAQSRYYNLRKRLQDLLERDGALAQEDGLGLGAVHHRGRHTAGCNAAVQDQWDAPT